MKGRSGEREVVILIDSGATTNFISAELAPALGLKVTEMPSFGVRVGNGQVFNGKGKCSGVLLEIQGVKIKEEFCCLVLMSLMLCWGTLGWQHWETPGLIGGCLF